MTADLNEWVTRIGDWHKCVFNWATLPDIMQKLNEEMHEVQVAFHDGDRNGVGAELADCLICVLAAMAREGINAETALASKFPRVMAKYRADDPELPL